MPPRWTSHHHGGICAVETAVRMDCLSFLHVKMCPCTGGLSVFSPWHSSRRLCGSSDITEILWMEVTRPCCFLTARSNGFTCRNKSSRQLIYALFWSSVWFLYFIFFFNFFFIRREILDVCLFLFHSHLFLTSLTESHTLIPTSSSASPSQVEMMYDLYCQLLPRVKRKLVMTRASLLCRRYTSSLSLLSWIHHECVGRNISLPQCVGAPWRGSLGLSLQPSTSIKKNCFWHVNNFVDLLSC